MCSPVLRYFPSGAPLCILVIIQGKPAIACIRHIPVIAMGSHRDSQWFKPKYIALARL